MAADRPNGQEWIMYRLLILAAAFAGAAAPALAEAESICADRESLVAALENEYGEQHRASGLQNARSMVEIWVSDETGTWTVLLTDPDGKSCVAASGGSWLEYPPVAVSEDVAG
jgi:hypothetical protein